jgi:hypothetical protein
LFSGSKTHGKLRLLSALSLLGVAGLASPLAEFSSLGRSPERLAAQEPVKNASQPPISVATEEDAIAEPHPKVLNFASTMILSITSICNLITSPHSGAPTNPVPTFGLDLSNVPTFLGFE